MRNTLCEFLIVIAASTLRFGRCSRKLKSVNDLKTVFRLFTDFLCQGYSMVITA